MNQTTQMHKISLELAEHDCSFTTYYGDGFLEFVKKLRLTETSVMGYKRSACAQAYLDNNGLQSDYRGRKGPYDLVVSCSDQVIQPNLRGIPMVVVQEGMTDPEGVLYRFWWKHRWFPRYIAGTSTSGLSNEYTLFCVASEGYRQHFIERGANPDRLVVTGIPNFDNCREYYDNDFPLSHYVLCCTSDCRETAMPEDRKATILNAVRIANGRQLIFKLHPNESVARATREIERYAPGALVYSTGHTEQMIANCDVLITRYSSVVYIGLALGKEVHSDMDVERLRALTPIQNASASREIAAHCRRILAQREPVAARAPLDDPGLEWNEATQ